MANNSKSTVSAVKNRNHKLIFKLMSIGLAILVAGFIGELSVRVYYFGWDAFSYSKVSSFIPIGESGFLQPAANSKILYELKPNIHSQFKLVDFSTNSMGQRDQEYELQKPAKTVRVLVFGDSFTMGSGVEIDSVYHSRVEQQLNKQQDGWNYELINMGVGGYNLLNYEGLFEAYSDSYNSDLVVVGYCSFNDYFIPPQQHYDGNYKVKVKSTESNPFWAFYLGGMIDRAFSPTTEKQLWKMSNEHIDFVDAQFARFRQLSDSLAVPVVIAMLHVLPDNGNMATVAQLAEKHGLPLTHCYGTIDAGNLADYTISKLDHHPNALAHAEYANMLLEFDAFQRVLEQARQNQAAD